MITEFKGPYRFLSNFHFCKFEWEGMTWVTAEHAFQAAKTEHMDVRARIQAAPTPSAARKLGRQIQLRSQWDKMRVGFMREIVRAKFTQSALLSQAVIATYPAHLEEGNTWNDKFWGVCKGKGKNMLGTILMDIRQELINSSRCDAAGGSNANTGEDIGQGDS